MPDEEIPEQSPISLASLSNVEPMPLGFEELKAKSLQDLNALMPVDTHKRTYSYKELHALRDEDTKFLVPELIPSGSVLVMIGEDGIGKTQLCTQLAVHIALGYDQFLGLALHAPHKRALIVATEDSKQKFIKACSRQVETLEPRKAPGDVHIDFTEASDFDDFATFKNELDTLFKNNFYDLVVLDALSDMFGLIDGEINSNTHARKLLSYFQHLCNTYNFAMIIIHHAAKSKIVMKRREGKMFVEKTDSQGAGAITQKPRTVLALSNDPGSIQNEGNEYENYLHVVKANLMGKRYMQHAIKLQFKSSTLLHSPRGLIDIEMMLAEQMDAAADAQKAGVDFTKRRKKPQDLGLEEHVRALGRIYGQATLLTREILTGRMCTEYGVGMTKIEEKTGYLPYLLEISLIEKTDFGFKYQPKPKDPGYVPITPDLPFG